MQAIQKPGQSLGHTGRYKPSKELILITKRKMDEANTIIDRLQNRLSKAQAQQERDALLKTIEELKIKYQAYLVELQNAEAADTQGLPHDVPIADTTDSIARLKKSIQADTNQVINENGLKKTIPQGYRPSLNNEHDHTPKEVQAGQSILKRRTCCPNHTDYQQSCKWSSLIKSNIDEGTKYEQEKQAERDRATAEYRNALKEQAEAKDHSRTTRFQQTLNKPKSPKLYDNSTFTAIGKTDFERTQNAPIEKRNLNQVYVEQIQLNEQIHKTETLRKKQEKDIDIDTGILPVDKRDQNGKVKKTAIPDKYLEGIEFSNQVKEAPKRENVVKKHIDKQLAEHKEIDDLLTLQKVEDDRNKMIEKKKQDTINNYAIASNAVMCKTKVVVDSIREQRVGHACIYPDDNEITNGNYYGTVNRKVHKQPDAHKDVIYGEGNFISKIDKADRKRAAEKSCNVLPLLPEEKQTLELKRTAHSNPQKLALDQSDINTIQSYIDYHQEKADGVKQKLADQAAYDKELREFAIKKAAESEDDIPDRLKQMLVPPKYIKAPF